MCTREEDGSEFRVVAAVYRIVVVKRREKGMLLTMRHLGSQFWQYLHAVRTFLFESHVVLSQRPLYET